MTKKQTSNEITLDSKTLASLESTLKSHATALNIPAGSAEIFIKKSITAATKTLKKRKIITRADLIRATTKELGKYNIDLAYVYENYDKII